MCSTILFKHVPCDTHLGPSLQSTPLRPEQYVFEVQLHFVDYVRHVSGVRVTRFRNFGGRPPAHDKTLTTNTSAQPLDRRASTEAGAATHICRPSRRVSLPAKSRRRKRSCRRRRRRQHKRGMFDSTGRRYPHRRPRKTSMPGVRYPSYGPCQRFDALRILRFSVLCGVRDDKREPSGRQRCPGRRQSGDRFSRKQRTVKLF